jgi:hypothetical protein
VRFQPWSGGKTVDLSEALSKTAAGVQLVGKPPRLLARGDSVVLTLQFAHAGAVTVTAWILEYAEADRVR